MNAHTNRPIKFKLYHVWYVSVRSSKGRKSASETETKEPPEQLPFAKFCNLPPIHEV